MPSSMDPSSSSARKTTCQRCRHRKVKCDAVRPACGRCTKAGLDCPYDGDVDHRTPPSWSYVRALEAKVGILQHAARNSLQHVGQSRDSECGPTERVYATNYLIRNPNGDVRYTSPSSFYHHLLSAERSAICDPPNLKSYIELGFRRYLPPEVKLSEKQHDSALETFFRYCCSPLAHLRMDRFLLDMELVLSRSSGECRTNHYSPMLHNLILATVWRMVDGSNSAGVSAETFFDYALRWFHVEVDRATLCTMTSMSLVANYCAGKLGPSTGSAYVAVGSAIVQAMGLHISAQVPNEGISERERVDREDALWAFYVIEAFWSLFIGRDCLQTPNIPTWSYRLRNDSQDEQLRFREIQLARIARHVYIHSYSSSRGDQSSEASGFSYELETWSDTLPSGLQLPSQLHHVSHSSPRLLLLHANHSMLYILYRRPQAQPMDDVGPSSSLDRCEAAAQRIIAIAECWSRIFLLTRSPIQLQHSLFTAGTTLLLRAAHCSASHRVTAGRLVAKVDVIIGYLHEISKTWEGAQQVADVLSNIKESYAV